MKKASAQSAIGYSAFRIPGYCPARISAFWCHGVTLMWVMVLLPAAALLLMAILSRIEVTMSESQRNQDRAQARLLAESGLLIAQDALRAKGPAALASPLPGGRIEGQGTYQVLPGESGAGPQRLLARGAVVRHQVRFICEIDTTLDATTQTLAAPPPAATLRVNDIRYRVERVTAEP